MDVINVARQIEKKIHLLEKGRDTLDTLALEKAQAIGKYEKEIAITLMSLRAGKPFELEGETIKDPPVSIMEKLVKGICWEVSIANTLADAQYKIGIEKMKSIEAELNGYQSINKNLEHI